ncbi:hypothetical protein CBOM_05685 [Ceraceosorus bombacis]|uniref:Uncharacterized protein n=1 Tax=Ceraceosorus bombacis TaxID=401625 RepID=A0A0P1BQ23_9BASI|nr:hypothetical protein CBOM_05685 [Ceraceosorus bombacis]
MFWDFVFPPRAVHGMSLIGLQARAQTSPKNGFASLGHLPPFGTTPTKRLFGRHQVQFHTKYPFTQ